MTKTNLPTFLAAVQGRLAASRMHRANEPITSPKLLLDDLAYALRVLAVAEEVAKALQAILARHEEGSELLAENTVELIDNALTHWTQVTQEGSLMVAISKSKPRHCPCCAGQQGETLHTCYVGHDCAT